jgi:hypothetical protein
VLSFDIRQGCTGARYRNDEILGFLDQAKVQTSQPMPAHIVLLILSASTHGHGDEYLRTGP